jgi:hypothetical protein
MNESQVRSRVHAAIGEATYPSAMLERVARGLNEPAISSHSRLYGLAATVLAVLLVVALVLTRFEVSRSAVPAPIAPPNARILPVDPHAQLPEDDLNAAHLAGPAAQLVTPLNMIADSNGHSIALIGAYADTSEIVLFFRSAPSLAIVQAEIYDRTGLLNFGSSGSGPYRPGDAIYVLDGGAHAGADGLAHLNVVVDNIQLVSGDTSVPGTWSFAFDIKVPRATALTLSPALRSVGGWNFTLETFEATPAVVRIQAVVDGVSIQQVSDVSFKLLASGGTAVDEQSTSTELIGVRFFFWTFGDRPTRIAVTWTRPPAGDYVLEIRAPRVTYRGALIIPAVQAPG